MSYEIITDSKLIEKLENNKKNYGAYFISKRKDGEKMKHEFNELWEAQENSKKVWKLQATKGIITFQTKEKAVVFQKAIEKGNK